MKTDDFGFGTGKNQNIIPISDPVISDGLIYELIWNSNGGQRLQLACIEEATQSSLWTSTIAEAGKSSDIVAILEKSRQEVRNFGNRVSLHGGSIYVNSNAGLIAKCDPRDGKPDWIHYYNTSPGPGSGALGSQPILFDDLVICISLKGNHFFEVKFLEYNPRNQLRIDPNMLPKLAAINNNELSKFDVEINPANESSDENGKIVAAKNDIPNKDR